MTAYYRVRMRMIRKMIQNQNQNLKILTAYLCDAILLSVQELMGNMLQTFKILTAY
jgi:hypothetical protein